MTDWLAWIDGEPVVTRQVSGPGEPLVVSVQTASGSVVDVETFEMRESND